MLFLLLYEVEDSVMLKEQVNFRYILHNYVCSQKVFLFSVCIMMLLGVRLRSEESVWN